mmetsp:Transcript_43410/g.88814  ORF Transcript_43410/g.88814 Transcript_43410/m.88814 type:complete len:1057 (+) Transcript_43410:288-3458(+)|eukprot:CAMPEP_0181301936 /NCGR_PEP_ID=MMETSP1101-20121128/7696_1 /TAXON_ID=46948 /ORGANISM="Rhodomonas abbreviata, Strain Caron Lab Isolate" /LENGTH=1056 /DNA_ID=CAMNT_0023407287 /DNA_START=285 /DNA_END=3455 /DNA_ORIENTATION=+
MSFGVTAEELSKFVRLCFENPLSGQVREKVIPVFTKFGESEGLISKLKTNSYDGIDEFEVKDRKEKFGQNYVEPEPPESIWMMAWNALQDPCLIFLCFAAMVSFVVGIIFDEGMEWLEGIAILCAVFVVVTVSAVNDYQKEQQFRALNAVKEDTQVTVVRAGSTKKVSTFDVVVGDVVLLSTGDMVCADGVIFDKNDLGISEAMLTGESVIKKKGMFDLPENGESAVRVSPALFAGTFVQEGEGRMVVVAVGANTYQGLMEEKMKEEEEEKSVLQVKLDNMTTLITKVGGLAGGLTVAVLLVRFAIAFWAGQCCKESWDHSIHHLEYLRFLVVGVTVFVVAVPEGLPLAVTIALAFSVKKMMADQNLVRHLSACETMGSATTICSDKTGTLTTGKMTVVKVWSNMTASPNIEGTLSSLPSSLQEMLAEAMVVNTSFKSDVEWDKNTAQVVKYAGNDTECAMLLLANRLMAKQGSMDKDPYRSIRVKYPLEDPDRLTISFSSDRKRMSTLVQKNGKYILYTKGASEIVLGLCTRVRTEQGEEELTAAVKEKLETAIGEFADDGLRTLSVAFREFDTRPEVANEEGLEEGLTLLALCGLEDPVRDEVPEAIRVCKRAGIVVRMVTGDNPRTAAAIARKCGILEDGGTILTGPEFRERVLGENDEIDMVEFDKVWVNLRVLARSSPLDKLTLVTGIQDSKITTPQTVAVTGDGTNDAPALKRADVGFAMGKTGTQVAQNAADIIVMDDNFASIVQAVKWGRCVYDNICKFLQFQLTVNLTACSIAVVGASILTDSPLNVIQLLWVNMIMDSFASLALATEDPHPSLLTRNPYPRDQPLLSRYMLRSLLCHGVWQLIVLFIAIFAIGEVCTDATSVSYCPGGALKSGRPASFDAMSLSDEHCVPLVNRTEGYCQEEVEQGHTPTIHYSLVFTVFVMMQLFNQINARKIHGEMNVFEGVFQNKYFLWIMGGEFLLQFLMVQTPGINTAMGCTGLSFLGWFMCILVGASELPLNLLIRQVPLEWLPASLVGEAAGSQGQGTTRAGARETDDVPMLAMGGDRA